MIMMGSPRKVASLIVARKLGGGSPEVDRAAQLRGESESALSAMSEEKDEGRLALEDAAQKLVSAVQGGSVELVADAFHKMFKICDLLPHEEYGEEIEEAAEGGY